MANALRVHLHILRSPLWLQQGFADKGGITASAAQPLHAKSGCWVSFDTIWQLVSPDTVSFSLDCSSFCLFMHLLKTSMKGIQLPISISKEQVPINHPPCCWSPCHYVKAADTGQTTR